MKHCVSAEKGWELLSGTSGLSVNLTPTLSGGQSFRWKLDVNTGEWIGTFRNTVWRLRQDESGVHFKVVGSSVPRDESACEKLLGEYFRTDTDLGALYRDWSRKDPLFKAAAEKFHGIRMLSQDPVENLFSFICSSNNHISRISSMIEKLCTNYGEKICEKNDVSYYGFPTVESLCTEKLESHLRELGFGYRAKYIHNSAVRINQLGGDKWFESLKEMSYEDAKKQLVTLPGIGPKVADCICLMSLNHLNAIPVDTHVFQIASRDYLPHLKTAKSVTDRIYNEIGDHFRKLYGPLAGWAHTILFCADLKKFEEFGVEKKGDSESKKRKRKR